VSDRVDDALERELLIAERRMRIAERVRAQGSASVGELGRSLGISASTVRRDLVWLEKREAIARTWGGAMASKPDAIRRTDDITLSSRQRENMREKALIAKAAADLVSDGDAVVIDAGSTTELMAEHLLVRQRLTVITTSLPLAWALRGHANIELIVTGGHVQTRASSLVGVLAEQTLSQLYADIAFIGARGLTPANGLTNPVLEEVPMKRLMVRIARRSVALVDSTKWGRVFMGLIVPVNGVSIVVTDNAAPSGMRGEVELQGTEVLIAE